MARTKTLSKAPGLRDTPSEIDFTYDEVNRCVIRFNKAAVVYLEYNMTTDAVSVVVENEIAGTIKTLTGVVETEV